MKKNLTLLLLAIVGILIFYFIIEKISYSL